MSYWRLFCVALSLCYAANAGLAQGQSLQAVDPSGIEVSKQMGNPNCQKWQNHACVVCGIRSTVDISVKSKTKTLLLQCQDMKPGPAKIVMLTHAEPTTSGVWEVEFGLGYQTATRDECPHQYIASNNPPLKKAYEVGPIAIESEIPSSGVIRVLACVGLSSARVAGEGKETDASLRIFDLRVISEELALHSERESR